MVVVGCLRRWAAFAVVVAACTEPTRRPPIAYERVPGAPSNDDDASSSSASVASASSSATASPSAPPASSSPPDSPPPAEPKGPAGPRPKNITAPSTSAPAASASAKPKLQDELCYKKLSGGCCGTTGVKVQRKEGRYACPHGYAPAAYCKNTGERCNRD